MYNVFTRSWWAENPDWPDGLEPCAGRKRYIRRNVSEAEARAVCRAYNAPEQLKARYGRNRLSTKAEYENARRL